MEPFARVLGLHKQPGFLICGNGTIIEETNTGRLVYEIKLPAKVALAAYDMASAEDLPVQIYEDDIMYISMSNKFTDFIQKRAGIREVVVENFREMVGNGCHKLIIPGDPGELRSLAVLIEEAVNGGATILTTKSYFLEVNPPGVDKGSALAKIAEQLGIQRGEVLAIGDSANDEAMVRWAGVGVAMLNGDATIKSAASFVSDKSNDDDGVADVIERYVLTGGGTHG
jgi:Cof subfamily protein (haloacid dehalogenase superfamily)